MIQQSTLNFLKDLKKNNNRDWFQENKEAYDAAHENMLVFAEALLFEMKQHDHIETQSAKKSLMRIYRDVRFSKDKTPYKINFGGGFKRATEQLRGGYYYHIEPGNHFIGGGFWGPTSDDLKRIRAGIVEHEDELRAIINDATFKKYFGELKGEQVKTAPKGYAKDHPAIDLLKHKQFLISKTFTDKEVQDPNFYKVASDTFQQMRTLFDFMSRILTTNLDGEVI